MLIVGIPKSASTSLMMTLGELHHLPARQVFFPHRPLPQGVRALWRHHSDVREIDADIAGQFADPKRIFKQHLPPTPNNLVLLRDQPKVILLRRPDEIIRAYRRARRRFLSLAMPGFPFWGSEQDWLDRAKENGLYADLEDFVAGWSRRAGDNLLIVWHDELIHEPERVVNEIERFWGLPQTEPPITLSQRRYSRSGYQREALFNVSRLAMKKLGLWYPARKLYRRIRRKEG